VSEELESDFWRIVRFKKIAVHCWHLVLLKVGFKRRGVRLLLDRRTRESVAYTFTESARYFR
jgi:hypothetical protein